MKKVFFLGGADAEMVEIGRVLVGIDATFVNKNLGWGAKASAYAEEIAATATAGDTPVLIELELDITVPEGTVVVDHHGDRAGEPAAILQVLNLLGIEPTRQQLLIAANDSGYIPAMLAIGAMAEEIASVRLADRNAQGITPEQEAEAERALGEAEVIGQLTVVRMAHSKTATVTDRLFGHSDQILVLSGDGEVNFFGNGALCAELKTKFEGWNGGSGLGKADGNGFWGGYPNHDEVLSFVKGKVNPGLSVVNQIVAVGSVDGVLTTAALLRVIGNPDVPVIFCQAFSVDKIDPTQWEDGRQVAFVDLAVDLKDNAKTKAFVDLIIAAGHKIVAVIDEHGRDLWQTCLGSFDSLIVEPQDRIAYPSSGSILLSALTGDEVDEHLFDLCVAAEASDKMDFTTHFGSLANQAVKSNITDDTRRVHLARHFAFNREADEMINGWVQEYEQILANHAVIIAAKQDLGSGIVRVDATGQKVDMTTLMGELYKSGARIVVVAGEQFNPLKKEKMVMVSFGTNDKSLDLLAALKTASVSAGGIAQKANVEPEQEEIALDAIRALLG